MTQSAKSPQSPDDSGEIDRIIQEIEQMEKSIDEVQPKAAETPKVVPLRAEADAVSPAPSMKDPIGFDQALAAATAREDEGGDVKSSTSDGGLALSVGGCSSISLEFTQSGMKVTLSYENDALVIKTDSGAEFRVPFRKAA